MPAKRENGSGTIYCRKYAHSTVYVAYGPARYILEDDGKAKAIRDKVGSFPTRKQAREALDLYLRHPTPKYNFTLSDVYEDWKVLAFADLKAQTVTSWTTSWAKIKACTNPNLSGKLIREITTGEIRQLLNYYATERTEPGPDGQLVTIKPLSKSYITKIKALMTQLFDHAMINNIVDRNYASLVKIPKMEAGTIRPMTDLEFAKLLKGWETAPGGDACLVLCYTGFRVTEFCQLTRFAYDPRQRPSRAASRPKPVRTAWCRFIQRSSPSSNAGTQPARASCTPAPMERHIRRTLSIMASGSPACAPWGCQTI